MHVNPKQKEEIFVIPRKDGKYYLYAALRRSVAVVNESTVNVVAKYLENGEADLDSSGTEAIKTLKEQKLLGDPIPSPPVFPEKYEFCPHEVTLFLTSQCNLRCRYCYAEAGKKNVDMPWEVAKSAIDLVAENAGLLGSKKFAVGFHGGGEPTLAWNLMVRCVEYSHQKGEETGLDVEIFAATNGLISQRKREYIAKKFTTLNISLDGPEYVQDYNRPKKNGKGSFDKVSETIRYFDKQGFRYGIRATVTSATVNQMADTVEMFISDFNPEYIHMEPVWMCGRCISSGEETPDDNDFVSNYLRAAEMGQRKGVKVFYSGARIDVITSKFCAAPGDGFSVLPEGIATSCYEITETDDPRAELFHYGRYDPNEKSFIFDHQRLRLLRKLSVENISYCSDCFCKWHCAGDCLAKVFEKKGEFIHSGSSRCELNRALTLSSIENIVKNTEI
ncbi:radical SAM protein [Desulfobacterales bacterium HSG2]|nr:radical SAM protein [Desulfobacterales bacterium HSG2]